jgi:hypothetical protein
MERKPIKAKQRYIDDSQWGPAFIIATKHQTVFTINDSEADQFLSVLFSTKRPQDLLI